MKSTLKHLLVIEDDRVDQMAFERFVERSAFPYSYQLVSSIGAAKTALADNRFDAILSDYFLGDGTCFEILELKLDLPIVIVTGTGTEAIAVDALKKGAADYIIKDIDGYYLTVLPITLDNALKNFSNQTKLRQYQRNLEKLVKTRTKKLQEEIKIRVNAEAIGQQALISAQKANKVKDHFIANISHEIRTPLNSILGFNDLFKIKYGGIVEEKDQIIFSHIENSSGRLMRAVDAILNFSQLNAGDLTIQKETLDLNLLISKVYSELKFESTLKKITFQVNVPPDPVYIFADTYCIYQAILHLVDNAIKYTDEGIVDLKVERKHGKVRLIISDSGIGISPEYLKRAFEPYTQESEGYSKQYQGLGLGLALVKQYLYLNDVTIEMNTAKNSGTTSILTFTESGGPHH